MPARCSESVHPFIARAPRQPRAAGRTVPVSSRLRLARMLRKRCSAIQPALYSHKPSTMNRRHV
ncbi:hypothetical protein DCN14_15095 [Burkholderia sp. IDO3]|nr:hypothetical protein DCN14_15095 [Burkholderia sp. IDO3]